MPRISNRNTREETSYLGAFLCEYCKTTVPGCAPGTELRTHCPNCLWSLHVDLHTGDRLSGCRGLVEPVGIATRDNGEWALIHRCNDCGMLRMNRIAGDDDPLPLLSPAVRPLSRPPFLLDQLQEMILDEEGGRS